jgi:biotin carboxylase
MDKLAILGASYLQVPLVMKANSMGIETHCFAWDNEEAVCKKIAHHFHPISVLDKEKILDKCVEIKITGIVTIASDICVPTIAYVAEKLNLISNSVSSSLLSTNKGKMREAFKRSNIASPKFITITTHSELESFEDFNYPLIVKPTDRSGSRGVSMVENKLELIKAVDGALEESLEKKVVVEEFFEGVEVSVESISWRGKHYILAITDKVTTGAPFFVEIEHHQPSQISTEVRNKINKMTLEALDALGIENGAGHSEFIINSDGEIRIIEVGARMGGDFIGSDLVELSTGYDYLKGTIEIALGEFNEPYINKENFSGVLFLCKGTEYILPVIKNYHSYPELIRIEILDEELKPLRSSGDRSGYLIYQAKKKCIFKKIF